MTDDNRIPTSFRALLILEIVSKSDEALTPTQINADLGLPKQSIHRLCSRLESSGFLVKDETGKRFRPSRRVRDMANGLLHASNVHTLRRQVLEALAEQIGETINFAVPSDSGMQYQDRVETDWAFRIQLPIGSSVPFHCTASGKAYLASLKPKAREKLVSTLRLEGFTGNTHSSKDKLLQELKQVAKQGYALDNEEFMDGMVASAVPVLDKQGRYFASLALHGPSPRLDLEKALLHCKTLQAGAERLTDTLF